MRPSRRKTPHESQIKVWHRILERGESLAVHPGRDECSRVAHESFKSFKLCIQRCERPLAAANACRVDTKRAGVYHFMRIRIERPVFTSSRVADPSSVRSEPRRCRAAVYSILAGFPAVLPILARHGDLWLQEQEHKGKKELTALRTIRDSTPAKGICELCRGRGIPVLSMKTHWVTSAGDMDTTEQVGLMSEMGRHLQGLTLHVQARPDGTLQPGVAFQHFIREAGVPRLSVRIRTPPAWPVTRRVCGG